ncbi:transporter substrate-binding domain-containing protein [Amorphus sp. MBR-141]
MDDVRTANSELAPSGRLRAAINFGNPVLARRDAGTGEAGGVSVALARDLARQLDLPLDLVPFERAGEVADAATAGQWDVCFLAIDPKRAATISFTAPYVIIEGAYLVPETSPFRKVDEVDRDGVRVLVGADSAYDLFLTRSLERATIVREVGQEALVAAFERGAAEVLAGIRQPLELIAAGSSGVRMLPGRFMAIEQAMGTPAGRPAAAAFLRAFVREAIGSGFVARALVDSGRADVTVAPVPDPDPAG